MLESLPQSVQDRAVEHLREYLEDVTDEIRWDENFDKRSARLAEMADTVKSDIANGRATPMDFDRL